MNYLFNTIKVVIFTNWVNNYIIAKKKMKTNKILIIAILIATILAGCKTQQRRPKPDKDTTQRISICELTQKTCDAQPQFTTMNISKMSMSVNYGEMQFTFRSSIRIATDSILSISIQPALGIEMFRAEFTPKGFIIYDKLNRRYTENSYEYIKLSWGLDLDYKAIEALFSHRLFTPTTTNPTEICKDFRIVRPITAFCQEVTPTTQALNLMTGRELRIAIAPTTRTRHIENIQQGFIVIVIAIRINLTPIGQQRLWISSVVHTIYHLLRFCSRLCIG